MGLILLPEDSAAGTEAASRLLPAICLRRAPLAAFTAIARAGFHHIELGAEAGETADPGRIGIGRLKAEFRQLDLSPGVLSWSGPAAARGAARKDALVSLHAALETAHRLGAPLLAVRATAEDGDPEGWRRLLDTLHDLSAEALRAGVGFAIEPGATPDAALRDGETLGRCLAAAPNSTRWSCDEPFVSACGIEPLTTHFSSLGHARFTGALTEQGACLASPGHVRASLSAFHAKAARSLCAVRLDPVEMPDVSALSRLRGELDNALGETP